MANYKGIDKCRICGNTNLIRVLDLGDQMLTGVFPRLKNQQITTGPLRLVKCFGEDDSCGLLQLEHSYDLDEMYGENYGYRSGLNPSMVSHLNNKVRKILDQISFNNGDLVVDIGSNDGTTLRAYPEDGLILAGIDPTGVKFSSYYPERIQLIPDFFSAELFNLNFPGKKAKVITSFSMFYDLEDPMQFMQEIYQVLADDGVWVFEQSYMPSMLETNSFDTVCHEHLEFYSLHQIRWMTDRIGFNIIDVDLNDVNGGSFSVTVAKRDSGKKVSLNVIELLRKEREMNLDTLLPYINFAESSKKTKLALQDFLKKAKLEGKKVAALGASTKGNVLLQYCGITEEDIFCVGEINPDKFGAYTPGTWIPIISEKEMLQQSPDYLIILPWHFKAFFQSLDSLKGISLVFPLPNLTVIEATPSLLGSNL